MKLTRFTVCALVVWGVPNTILKISPYREVDAFCTYNEPCKNSYERCKVTNENYLSAKFHMLWLSGDPTKIRV